MLPLSFAAQGEDSIVRRVGGEPEARRHLEDLGFVAGSRVRVITETAGNLIVEVKGTRIAISREAAQKVMV